VTAQSLTWLSTKWNVNVDSLFTSTTAKSVRDAKLIKVIPVTNAGSAEICHLLRDKVRILLHLAHSPLIMYNRSAGSKTSHSFSKSVGSSMMPRATLLHPNHTR